MQERLQKIIARAGIASRRHAEQLILRLGLSDQRRRLCRCDVEELGKYRAGLSRQSKRNANSSRSRALGQGNWREDANPSPARCDTRPRRELLVRSADAQLEKRRDA